MKRDSSQRAAAGSRALFEHPAMVPLLLAAAVLIVFWPVLHCDFINYDDPEYVTENPHVGNGLSWANFLWAFQATDNSSWYPMTWLSFLAGTTLFGRGAMGAHFINLLLHTLNSVLVFLLFFRWTRARWRSAFVAALFALHPLGVEAVAWVSERKGLLSSLFGLLTLWAYSRYAGYRKTPTPPNAVARVWLW